MKQKLILVLAIAATIACNAQTVTPVVLANDGGYSSLSAGSISWSIGEPVSETYTASTNITTMGFHQPELSIITLIKEQGEDKSVLVYPNPVKDLLNVSFSGLAPGNYIVELIDNLGKLIYRTDTEVSADNYLFQIKINEVAAGNYFLRVNNKEISKTVKINKIN